jgi:AmmeMemoRadiSam system protein B
MAVRPIENALFYTDSPDRCRAWVTELSESAFVGSESSELVAGIVPHAGWRYSGAVAAEVWKNLQARSTPEVIVVFGAVHYAGVARNAVYPAGSWDTPLGPVSVDSNLAGTLRARLDDLLDADAAAHDREHSIEVQMPFVHELFKGCRILPIAVPPGVRSAELGVRVAEVTRDLPVIAVGSTDLTHYGERYHFLPAGTGERARDWMRANDRRMLDLVLGAHPENVVEEAREHRNACGAGAIAATLAFARERGQQAGTLLQHTTSHAVEGKADADFKMAVGYAGVVF